ncbi:MAG: adenylate/guanylate cyclase domain-containing protein [Desulfobacterales bacterium]|nr:MAG: adenylate/guanylate cyclase domain-containing protein [Desulfobacterales bacterium]
MADEGFKRKLTAILSADVEGYSRLMGDDEEATVRTLTSYREVLSTLIQQHNGKVLDSPGDNLLAEFVSVVDAVQCSVAVQKEISARNSELPENRRMQFRIGINLGDVIQEEGRIYGDGVNIASRLEGLAEPGGICISKTAFDHIESKLPYGYEFLGDQTVKNIAKPVGAYRVLMQPRVTVAGEPEKEKRLPGRRIPVFIGVATVLVLAIVIGVWQFYVRRPTVKTASEEKMAYPLPDKPSIAVMSFNNMSGDPELDYIGDSISENIISALAKIPYFFVIARNSTFFYKDKQVKVTQIGRELGVRYVLEGSFLKSGEKVRINAQLIDALKGHHVWSETYNRPWTDLLSLIDEITLAVMKPLVEEVGVPWPEKPELGKLTNFDAWLLSSKAVFHGDKMTREDLAKAINLTKQSIDIEPHSKTYGLLANLLMWNARMGWATSPEESMKQAKEMIRKALDMDDSNPIPHLALGQMLLHQKKYNDALAEYQKALDLFPNWDFGHYQLGRALLFSGQPKKAVSAFKEAKRLNPHCSWFFPALLGRAYFHTGRYAEALAEYEEVHKICSRGECNMLFPHIYLAMVYSKLGNDKEASDHMEKALEYNPRFNLEARRSISLFKNKEDTDREIDALRKAGAPEHPPS